MKKSSIFLSIIILCAGVFSCASQENAGGWGTLSMQEQAKSGHWVSLPSNGQITIIGVSNRMVTRGSEIDAAKLDAARKVSLFRGVEGTVDTVNASGPRGFFDIVNVITENLVYDKDYEKFVEGLKFDPEKDVYRTADAVFVQFKYNASMPPIQYEPSRKDGRPGWITSQNLPQFDGYITVVGIASKQRWFKDTVTKSTNAAIIKMIQEVSTTTYAGNLIRDSSSGGSTMVTDAIHTVSEGKLSEFLILELYIKQDGTIYTLAIAKKVGN